MQLKYSYYFLDFKFIYFVFVFKIKISYNFPWPRPFFTRNGFFRDILKSNGTISKSHNYSKPSRAL